MAAARRFRFIETGDIGGEDLYAALGRTDAGRYLIIYFVYKATKEALIVSAREMTRKEKRTYAKKEQEARSLSHATSKTYVPKPQTFGTTTT